MQGKADDIYDSPRKLTPDMGKKAGHLLNFIDRWTQEAESLANRLSLLGQCIGLQSTADNNNGKPSKDLVAAIEARVKAINDKVVEDQVKANFTTDGVSTPEATRKAANKEAATNGKVETIRADVAELLQIDSPVLQQGTPFAVNTIKKLIHTLYFKKSCIPNTIATNAENDDL